MIAPFLIIGIDISARSPAPGKAKLDWCNPQIIPSHQQTDNTVAAIKKLIRQWQKLASDHELVICAEYTGHYNYPLIQACQQSGVKLWLEGGAQIKTSIGFTRGKNDQRFPAGMDAQRIADYAQRFQDQMRLYSVNDEHLEKLALLQREREMYVTDRARYKGQITDRRPGDMKGFMSDHLYKQRANRLKKLIKELNIMVAGLDDEMDKLLKQNYELARKYKIMCSVKGIGRQTALETLIATKGFTRFDSPRQFCCHIGTAPFDHSSGQQDWRKRKVSQRANKKLKCLYHMAAMAAVSKPGELQNYFLRKVEQGKNKMSVINAVRAKLVHRVYALIREDRLYEPIRHNILC